MTIWTKQSPPTGLSEAGALGGWSGPVARPAWRGGLRALFERHPFKLLVLLPALLAGIYLFGLAAPQYESEARFLVRGRQQQSSGALSEALQGAGFSRANEEAMGVRDWLQSHDAVAALRGQLDLPTLWRRPEADALARLWWPNPSAERLLDYFRRMVTAEYDQTSGITTLRVRAFRAEDAQAVADGLLGLAETLVNRLNQRLQEDGLLVARAEVTRAEARLAAAQDAVTSFRERERAVDPQHSASLALETVAKLESQLAQTRAELAEAQRFTRGDNPRVLQLKNRADGLAAQLAEERRRVASRDEGFSTQVGEYERLNMERELARTQLASATSSLERARVEAQRQQIFLLRVVEPNRAEWARYPRAALSLLYILLCLSVAYGLGWLLVAGTREHAA
ncbi:MAG TPA: capsule biosynthesis protein [Crenalkalicoccus sp.]|jgi:capsular polysaccharide transport system permease protein|nr:capsule biosynthesis protein [Crenalkalicoccus sp.]